MSSKISNMSLLVSIFPSLAQLHPFVNQGFQYLEQLVYVFLEGKSYININS
ncbi:hypothetical protein GLYMA_10G193650v4 [Glycine max]|nr:hypothetical protein GLYMA_10G193650v4 [Glycine max]KAH1139049.1 hypothetical protein GYH30_028487 [Glycine max]